MCCQPTVRRRFTEDAPTIPRGTHLTKKRDQHKFHRCSRAINMAVQLLKLVANLSISSSGDGLMGATKLVPPVFSTKVALACFTKAEITRFRELPRFISSAFSLWRCRGLCSCCTICNLRMKYGRMSLPNPMKPWSPSKRSTRFETMPVNLQPCHSRSWAQQSSTTIAGRAAE